MRKKKIGLLVILLAGMLTGCTEKEQENTVIPEKLTEVSEEMTDMSETEETEKSAQTEELGIEMTLEERHGGQVKEDEDYQYICSYYRIYKIDKESGEAEVLWEQDDYKEKASLFDYGTALLVGDKLYFIEEKIDSATDNVEYVLSMIYTDGSDYQTLITDISLGNATLFLQEDLLYIANYEGEFCYRLLEDGSLEKQEAGTYTQVPEGYRLEYYVNNGRQYLSAAESMERYGYMIAVDTVDTFQMVKMEESGSTTPIEANWLESLSENWLLFREYQGDTSVYFVLDAKTLERKCELPFAGDTTPIILGMDNTYIYYGYTEEIVDGVEDFAVERIAIESGETERLFSLDANGGGGRRYFAFEYGMLDFSAEQGKFYYADDEDYAMYIMSRSLSDIENAKVLTPAFYDSRIGEVGTTERDLERIFSDSQPDVELMKIQTERLVVDETFPGAAKINQFLKDKEASIIAYGEESAALGEQGLQESSLSLEDSYYAYAGHWVMSAVSEITYFDGKYFSFYQEEEAYEGGAHGLSYRTGYAFDLQTGELLGLKDIVENEEEELKEIITTYVAEYINKNPEEFWENAMEMVEENAGYDSSFYLSEEGIVFYYEPYFISSYAAGFQKITIPFEAFELKIPLENGTGRM